MKICLIGQNLTNLILASVFNEKKLNVDIYLNKKFQNIKTDRTIALSSENFDYLKFVAKSNIISWKSKEIKIFTEDSQSEEIINFNKKNKEVFNLASYSKLNEIFFKKIKKSKFIKLNYLDTSSSLILDKIKKYDLVINSENKNFISNKFFTNKIKKNYRSRAYTFLINHPRKDNNTAIQVFTKFGPLAFLPLSKTKTSIVFSYKGVKIDEEKILDIFKKYNSFYAFAKINKIENFSLSFEMLRNYTYNNILAFGDLIHRIHPLAGQGFNMTIRDIKIISKIVNHRISLGLPIDISVAEDFQSSTKHLNYLYGKAIDGIYEFFRLDSNINNSISKPVFSILNKNSIFKKYSNVLSDKGFNL
jgi:2-octaprenyl-6-methoxyphenol hydroxylase